VRAYRALNRVARDLISPHTARASARRHFRQSEQARESYYLTDNNFGGSACGRNPRNLDKERHLTIMANFHHTKGKLTGNVVGPVRELRTQDGKVVLTFHVDGTKRSAEMRGSQCQVSVNRDTFVCLALAELAGQACGLSVGDRIAVDTKTIPTTDHLPLAPDLPPTVEYVTTFLPFAAS
jgi:hypothetical protein